MAKPKQPEKKAALKNAGKISVELETETMKTKKAGRPKSKPVVGKTAKPVSKKSVIKAKGEGGEKKAFISEPKQARPHLPKRNFMLLDAGGNDIGKFTGSSPRQSALKIANSGVTDIVIRETGVRRTRNIRGGKVVEQKLHHFEGSRIQRAKTDKDPAWLPDLVNIPRVYKINSEWVEVKKNDA